VLLGLYPSTFHLSITTHTDIPQVAITLDYRYQPPASAPIDAGKWCQVMEKERVIATRFFEESQ
jgi:hypothetical protein